MANKKTPPNSLTFPKPYNKLPRKNSNHDLAHNY